MMSPYKKLFLSVLFFLFALCCDVLAIRSVSRAGEPDVPLLPLYEATPSDLATPSDAERDGLLSDIDRVLRDLYDRLFGAEEMTIGDVGPDVMEVALDDLNVAGGVAVYNVSFGGGSMLALFPLSAAEYLSVTDDGLLVNTGSDPVSGRLVSGDLDVHADTGYSITLTGILNPSVFSTVYNNGHAGYVTHHYISSGRLQSTSTYYDFTVTDYELLPPQNSLSGHSYAFEWILILLMGGVLLCLLRRSWS